jgi:hypothetical protein
MVPARLNPNSTTVPWKRMSTDDSITILVISDLPKYHRIHTDGTYNDISGYEAAIDRGSASVFRIKAYEQGRPSPANDTGV